MNAVLTGVEVLMLPARNQGVPLFVVKNSSSGACGLSEAQHQIGLTLVNVKMLSLVQF